MNTIFVMPKILFLPIINIIILFFLGYGLTRLILPKKLENLFLWLSPWTTIVVSIFILVIVSLMGISVKHAIWPLVTFFLSINLYALLKIRPLPSVNIREDFLLFCFVIVTLILNLSPLIRRDKVITTISFGNNDVIAYTVTGDYLKDNSISKSFKETVEQSVGVLLNDGYRWGTPMINALFLTICNCNGYQYTYVSQAILFSLFIPLCYILFKTLFNPSLIGLITISFFVGFNNNLLYILYHDFFGQVLFWGLGMLLFIFLYSYFYSEEIRHRKFNIYDYNIGILIAVIFFSYHEPAIFMFAPLGIFLIINIFNVKNFTNYISALFRVAIISMISATVSISRALIVDFKQAFMSNPNQPIGWQLFRNKIPFANPFEAMGFWSIHNFEPLPTILAVILSIIVIFIIARGIIKSKYKVLTVSYLIIFVFFLFWTAIGQHNFFSYNRALTYTLPFILVLFSIGIVSLYKVRKSIWTVIIVLMIILEFFSAIKLNKRFITERLSVEKSFISILELKNRNIKGPIYAESFIEDATPLWKQIWIGYFLYSKGISPMPTVFVDNQFANRVPNNSLVLVSKPTPWLNSLRVIYKDIIWENEYYKLGHICNTDECLIKSKLNLNEIIVGKNDHEDSLFMKGWNIAESESRWADEKESTLRLVTKDTYPTYLTVEALSLNEPQEMIVYIDENLLGQISIKKEWKSYNLPINYPLNIGVHQIKFIYTHGYRPIDIIPGNLDGRTLYVNFKKIALEQL